MSNYFPLIFLGFIASIILYSYLRYGGIKAAMFGARIRRTVDEIRVRKGSLVRMKLRVHSLEDSSSAEPRVGLELVTTAVLSYSMMPVSLSREEARELCQFLSDALAQ